MKRLIAFLVTLCLCTGLCACGSTQEPTKSVEVQKVEELIANIGEVDINSKTLITEAYTAYDNLTEEMRTQVENIEALTKADNEYAEMVVSKLENEKYLTLEEAYSYIENCVTRNENLSKWIELVANLQKSSGTFYQSSESGSCYEATLVMYLQYGEPWFEIEYSGYMGSISDGKMEIDGENGFLFKATAAGRHTNIFTGNLQSESFTLRFGEEKLYIAWGRSIAYYLSRTK